MKRHRLAFLILAALAAQPVATAYALCHTNEAAQACDCCPQPVASTQCGMDCADEQPQKKAEPLSVTLPRSEQQADLHPATPASVAVDATAVKPLRLARIPKPSFEALYLIDCTFRL